MDLCDGNPGAINVMIGLHRTQPDGLALVRTIEQSGLRGPDIWCLYKDTHHQDFDALANYLRTVAA
jgi:hypothetical protein